MAALAAAVLLSGCALDLGDIPFLCNKGTPRCPDGYTCTSGYCHKSDECPGAIPGCQQPLIDATPPGDAGADLPQIKLDGQPIVDAKKDKPTISPDSKNECVNGNTKCVSKTKFKICLKNTWNTDTCENICKLTGYDYSGDCQYNTKTGKAECPCGKYVGFGGLCNDNIKCNPAQGLICASFGTATTGYCTKYCTNLYGTCPGYPSGTMAKCTLQIQTGSGLKYACGFTCGLYSYYNCPVGMKCDFVSELCKP